MTDMLVPISLELTRAGMTVEADTENKLAAALSTTDLETHKSGFRLRY